VTTRPLELTRTAIIAHRRAAGTLDERLSPGPDALRHAAWAGLQDSMPRAALLSIHARVQGTEPSTWEDPSLIQLWGPRFSAYVVAERDRGVFALARLPDDEKARRFAQDLADRLERFLDGRSMSYADAGRAIGVQPNALRYAAATGRVLIRWDGAARPTVWTVPPPGIEPLDARVELARRFLHVFGPGTPASFGGWAGIRPPAARAAFDALALELTPARTPIGDAWILTADEPSLRAPAGLPARARLLPSGDALFLLQGADRELLVPDADRRGALWTSRVWPGALLVDGEVAGTWRRAEETVRIRPWRRLTAAERDAVEAEACTLPLPGTRGPIRVAWEAEAD
jgi:hypothetical protein